MKKIIFIVVLLAGVSLAQEPVRSYRDSVSIGDSINTYLFANPHEWLRITVVSSVANDTLFISAGSTDTTVARIGMKQSLEGEHVQIITGNDVTDGDVEDYRQYWLYAPGGYKYVRIRRSDAVTTVEYIIESMR